jgi:crossover junction endodeoxyribonuclease RuvC
VKILGVDPGHTGALVLLDMRVEAVLADIVRRWRPEHAIYERVHSMPQQGVASTFAFGLAYGAVRGVLAGLAIPTTPVDPPKWRRLVELSVGADKDAARARAAQLFPAYAYHFSKTAFSGRADAALIALAGFRTLSPF